jgi:tetratricopeptide (TPR) repeat protein
MHQDRELIWAEIKKYEQRLEKNPESYLFARLSEVYLKVNLIDDALHVARQGIAKYPYYIAGQRALAMASIAKGLNEECLQALQKVAAASPEDLEVQKLLGKLFAEKGNREAAQKAFNTVLEFNPDDEECQVELNNLLVLEAASDKTYSSSDIDFGFGAFIDEPEDEIIELSEADIVEEPDLESTITEASGNKGHDPLTTATVAELYVKQGFEAKAIGIYRSILAENPFNIAVRTRLEELEAITAAAQAQTESLSTFKNMEKHVPELPASLQGVAAQAIDTLEEWLENIRRIKACR